MRGVRCAVGRFYRFTLVCFTTGTTVVGNKISKQPTASFSRHFPIFLQIFWYRSFYLTFTLKLTELKLIHTLVRNPERNQYSDSGKNPVYGEYVIFVVLNLLHLSSSPFKIHFLLCTPSILEIKRKKGLVEY